MLHHFNNDDQIDHKHQHDRYQGCLKKCIRIPDRLIGRKAVTVIIHGYHNIFKYRIAKHISD